MKAFVNALVYVEGEGLKKTTVAFGERITEIGSNVGKAEEIALPENAIVLPGFIDEHIHGAGGSDAMDGTQAALKTIAETVAAEGTTTFLATTMTQSKENITRAMTAVKEYRAAAHEEGARLGGVHLEGPFIAAAHKGAQPLEYVAKPSVSVFDEYNEASGRAIRIVTLAPEEEGAEQLIAHLAASNIVPSIGHTGAKCADILRAMAAGAKNITHTYNAQSPLHHREIGTVGSALLYDGLNAELIADTIHVSVPAIQLLVKCKPNDKLTLITDAMRAKGLQDGVSELGGQTVIVKNGEARLEDGTLAGSVLRMNRAVGNLVEKAGVPLLQAVDYATINPARTLGIDGETGGIRVGKLADFAVLDDKFNVLYTIRDGRIVYRA
ncbi:MAG TPA: N-acetylglucosamine-6-phosphate deacetylase [Candidatus Scatosoma pullistercoris]|uniref:N-acetylglucosamine-6-phosphate deacetylase n=1 Tax=Candidatus Scatosoma pullistercoris TaxID=2840934 RepID=A0A9D1MFE7_9FIRM|nr:N-acetylglucosamine-6-phosphate deacetylase [Candidatus Scatosoma pullistercoris]